MERARQGKDKLRMAASKLLRITDDGDDEIFAKQKAKINTKESQMLSFPSLLSIVVEIRLLPQRLAAARHSRWP